MTKWELERKLRKAGWVITHDMATHPQKAGIKIPIPKHSGDIPKGTVKSILKDAGLE